MNSDTREITSYNPSTEQVIWTGVRTEESEAIAFIADAHEAQQRWDDLGLEGRKAVLSRFAEIVQERFEEVAAVIAEDNGKPLWEARTEAQALIDKVQASFDAFDERALPRIKEASGRVLATRFRPHGVMIVIGPFNFPMHMANCHITPALLAGNAVVFKPSSRTLKAAALYEDLWKDAGLPEHVLHVAYGGGALGEFLISQPNIDGILFVGSRGVGVHIEQKLAERTDIIRALEMGGNGPLVVWDYADLRAAIYVAVQSGYVSSGQRCSSTRRLIVNREIADEFIPALKTAVESIAVGDAFSTDPVPFMGPLIDKRAVDQFLADYQELIARGAQAIVPTGQILELGSNFVKPALVDSTGVQVEDKEIFGPLLQLHLVGSFEEAIAEANRTQYGLTAGIITQREVFYDLFFKQTKAGIINWNQPTTGAPVDIPFGGLKASGNHRPAGYLSVDYCSYACASSESSALTLPDSLLPGLAL